MRPPASSVLAVLIGSRQYSFLVELINLAGLNHTLQQLSAEITLFAPTNQVNYCQRRPFLSSPVLLYTPFFSFPSMTRFSGSQKLETI